MIKNRLTKLGKHSRPELRNKLYIERAISLLYEYENTDKSPSEIYDLQETIDNLRQRIKKLEDWG